MRRKTIKMEYIIVSSLSTKHSQYEMWLPMNHKGGLLLIQFSILILANPELMSRLALVFKDEK